MEIVDPDQVQTYDEMVKTCNTRIEVHKDSAIEYISGNEYSLAIDELCAVIELENTRNSLKDKE